MKKNKKVVLAFSGGLDTSYCVKYLKHIKDLEVISVVVNTGGFSCEELKEIKTKAYDLGVSYHACLKQTQQYYKQIVKYLIFGNILKNGTYPLSVSSERIHQAVAIAKYAKSIGADYIAHGSTGAGNDQIRFDVVFQLIAPEIKILTPIRDQQLSRKEEIDFLKEHGVEVDWKKAVYSVNKGLWGTSVGGSETLTSDLSLPNSAFPTQLQKNNTEILNIEFCKGELCALNGEKMDPVSIIQALEKLAGKYAVGRGIHVGDTIIGIKGRVGFEAPAAEIIIKAHHLLEKHTLTKWQMYWKEQLANWYGMFIHEAKYFEPVMRNIETFLQESQAKVSGKVWVTIKPFHFTVNGIESKHDLMKNDFGDYGEMNKSWSADDVKGFTKIMANSMQVYNAVNN